MKQTLPKTLEKPGNNNSDLSTLFTEHFKSSRMPSKALVVEWPLLKPDKEGPNREASSKNAASCFSSNLSNITDRVGKMDNNHLRWRGSKISG